MITRSATSATKRSSCVAAIRRRPGSEVAGEDLDQAVVVRAVLPERRLVEDEDGRIADQRASPATVAAPPRPDSRKGLRAPNRSSGRPKAQQVSAAAGVRLQPEHDLGPDRLGQELAFGVLEDVTGAPRELVTRQPCRIVATQPDRSARGAKQADEEAPERRLAAAVWTDQADPLSAMQDSSDTPSSTGRAPLVRERRAPDA